MMRPSSCRQTELFSIAKSCGSREKSVRLRLGAVGASAEGWRAASHSQERAASISQSRTAIDPSEMSLPHRRGAASEISRDSQGRQKAAEIMCAAARVPARAREELKPLNYPGCKQRRPRAQAAEPRRAGAEQGAEFISLSHAAAMSRSPGSNQGFYHQTRKSFM